MRKNGNREMKEKKGEEQMEVKC